LLKKCWLNIAGNYQISVVIGLTQLSGYVCGVGEGIDRVSLLFLFQPFFELSLKVGHQKFWLLPTQGKKGEFDTATGAISLQNNLNSVTPIVN